MKEDKKQVVFPKQKKFAAKFFTKQKKFPVFMKNKKAGRRMDDDEEIPPCLQHRVGDSTQWKPGCDFSGVFHDSCPKDCVIADHCPSEEVFLPLFTNEQIQQILNDSPSHSEPCDLQCNGDNEAALAVVTESNPDLPDCQTFDAYLHSEYDEGVCDYHGMNLQQLNNTYLYYYLKLHMNFQFTILE